MSIYILMFAYSVFFSFLAVKQKRRIAKIICTILASIPFILISAIRYDVGTDYLFRYVPDYLKIVAGNDVDNMEPLFKLLMKICIFISENYITLFIVTSTLIISLIMISIYKNSKNILLSVIIFVVGSFFFQSLNIVRQFIAVAILFFSYKYLFEKNKIYWIISLVMAFLIHTSSIIFIVAILLYKRVLSLKLLIISSIIIILVGLTILQFALHFLGNSDDVNIKKYYAYISMEGDLNFSSLIPEVAIYLYLYYRYLHAKKNNVEIDNEGIFFINMQFLAVICTLMNMYSQLFFRITLIFSIFKILSIPYFYQLRKMENEKKIETHRFDREKDYMNWILCAGVVLLLTARMGYTCIIKGADEVLPYKTIFEVDLENDYRII